MTNKTERLHSRRYSRSLRQAVVISLYNDALVDAAEELRQVELRLQETIRTLDQYGDVSRDVLFESDEDDFDAARFENTPDPNLSRLLRLLQQVSATREQMERTNAIEI